MAATSPSDFYADHAWLLGEAANEPCPTDSARRLRETRIAAAVFKRRWRLLIGWRTQTRLKEQTCHRPGPKIKKIAPQKTNTNVVKGETLFSRASNERTSCRERVGQYGKIQGVAG